MPQRMSKDDLLARLGAMADPEVRARNLAAVKATLKATGDLAPEMVKGLAEIAALMKPKRAKYGNKIIMTPYGKFHSKGEYERYLILLEDEKEGKINCLARQITYPLIEGTEIDRPMNYKLDFQYDENGRIVVEDYKGYSTQEWINKRKLFREKYPRIELRVTKRKKR